MADETATKMYESARDRLKELLRQETEAKEQISHWGPIVEQLARLSGETLDQDIANAVLMKGSPAPRGGTRDFIATAKYNFLVGKRQMEIL